MIDALSTSTIAFRARIRQSSIWLPLLALIAVQLLANSIRPRELRDPGLPASELSSACLLLGWLTAASGTRATMGERPVEMSKVVPTYPDHTRFFIGSFVLGSVVADSLVVGGGTVLLMVVRGAPPTSLPALLLLIAAAAVIGAASSLQMELASTFVTRPLALVATALVTIVTLGGNAVRLPFPGLLSGGLVFPLSGLARLAEEPFRLELVARAILAGATYDLAILAALLALLPIRARGKA